MKILIDMQAMQTPNSRDRGIGRYAMYFLDQLIALSPGSVELLINSHFTEASRGLVAKYAPLVGDDHLHFWEPPERCYWNADDSNNRIAVARLLREAKIRSIAPDVMFNFNLFEGFTDDAHVSAYAAEYRSYKLICIAYDFIPFIFKNHYLSNPTFAKWYFNQVTEMEKHDLVLCISETTERDFKALVSQTVSTAVIYGSVDEILFADAGLKQRLPVSQGRPYIIYTGGNEWRKNLPFLLRSFLMSEVSSTHDLKIVCNIDSDSIFRILDDVGLREVPESIEFTGFVSDKKLKSLYLSADLLVFPSLYEGLGMPIIEAARCGVPVITSNTSSMIEIVSPTHSFDPYNAFDCARLMAKAIYDGEFRSALVEDAVKIAARFSWSKTVELALSAIRSDRAFTGLSSEPLPLADVPKVPRVAYFSPLNPEMSGISDYSEDIIPALSRIADIVIVTNNKKINKAALLRHTKVISIDEFSEQPWIYDAIIYNFGNSPLHEKYFDLLSRTSGTVVLHDVFLSGVLSFLSHNELAMPWLENMYRSHGIAGTMKLFDRSRHQAWQQLDRTHPSSFGVIDDASAVVLHSQAAKDLIEAKCGNVAPKIGVTALPSRALSLPDRVKARRKLGIADDEIVFCTFGIIADTKCPEELVLAWINSENLSNRSVRLIFVGACPNEGLRSRLSAVIERNEARYQIQMTGYVDDERFVEYLACCDVAVQLRRFSRGESSLAVSYALAAGLPLVVNANGAFAELAKSDITCIPDNFSVVELTDALETALNSDWRTEKALASKQHWTNYCNVKQYAKFVLDTSLKINNSQAYWRRQVFLQLRNNLPAALSEFDHLAMKAAFDRSFYSDRLDVANYFDIRLVPQIAQAMERDSSRSVWLKTDTRRQTDFFDARHETLSFSVRQLAQLFPDSVLPKKRLRPLIQRGDRLLLSARLGKVDVAALAKKIAQGVNLYIYFDSRLCQELRDVEPYIPLLDQLIGYCDGIFVERSEDVSDVVVALDAAQKDLRSTCRVPVRQGALDELLFDFDGAARKLPLSVWAAGERLVIVPSDPRLGVKHGIRIPGQISSNGEKGHLIYGPYLSLEAGSYRLTMHGRCSNPDGALVEIVKDGGTRPLAVETFSRAMTENLVLLSVEFSDVMPIRGLEIRIESNPATELQLRLIDIVRLPDMDE